MKLAKKVLAIVMALGLIACMSAMAFANDYGFDFDAVKDTNGIVTVTVTAKGLCGASGLTSGTIKFKTADGAKYLNVVKGAEAKAVNEDDIEGNAFYADCNGNASGDYDVVYGFYFKDYLWAKEKFIENGLDDPNEFSAADFEIAVFTFDVSNGGSIYAYADGQLVNSAAPVYADELYFGEVPVTKKTVDALPSETADKKEDKAPVAADDAAATTTVAADCNCDTKAAAPAVKTDGGKNTGDNGVLAVVAGVVALAGAAFVVTKKRK